MNQAKQKAAQTAAQLVEDGMLLGLGSGSTAELAVRAIAERVHSEGLSVVGVPSSERTGAIARELGIPVVDLSTQEIDLTIDGADEVDPQYNLLKGKGGALFHEKLVAAASKQVAIVVDSSKLVSQLGTSPVPVEVAQFGWEMVNHQIDKLGGIGRLANEFSRPICIRRWQLHSRCTIRRRSSIRANSKTVCERFRESS